MAVLFAFIGIWLVSLVVAMLAALQLGDHFRANDEFPLIIAALTAFGTAAMAVFAVSYAAARRLYTLHGAALVLALAAFWPLAAPAVVQAIAAHSTNPYTVGVETRFIAIELVVPALLAVLVQWGLARRRWLRAAGEDDLARFPWIIAALAGLVVLNPLGLDILGAALVRSRTDWLWQLRAMISGGVALALVVMALIECYIRSRMLRRRKGRGPAAVATASGAAVR
jgi:hypothetical protein